MSCSSSWESLETWIVGIVGNVNRESRPRRDTIAGGSKPRSREADDEIHRRSLYQRGSREACRHNGTGTVVPSGT